MRAFACVFLVFALFSTVVVADVGETLSACSRKIYPEEKDSCYRAAFGDLKDTSICETGEDELAKIDCYYYIAIKENDADICDQIETGDSTYSNRINCRVSVAKENKDVSACDRMGGYFEKDLCYRSFVQDAKDAQYCGKIVDNRTKDGCYVDLAIMLKDPRVCDKIRENGEKDRCVSLSAIVLGDSGYCGSIGAGGWRDRCYSELSRKSTAADTSLCDGITDPMSRSDCYSNIKYKQGLNHTLLKVAAVVVSIILIVTVLEKRGHLMEGRGIVSFLAAVILVLIVVFYYLDYTESNARLRDPGTCPGIKDQAHRDRCYLDSVLVNEHYLCEKIADDRVKDDCVFRADGPLIVKGLPASLCNLLPWWGAPAFTFRWGCAEWFWRGDYTVCDRIGQWNWADSCFRDDAKRMSNMSLCGKIREKSEREGCMRGFANATWGLGLCDGMSEGYQKDSCYSYMTEKTKNDTLIEKNTMVPGRNDDAGICSGIKENDQHRRDICHAIVNRNFTYCEGLLREYTDWPLDSMGEICVSDYARFWQEPSLCEKLSNRSQVYYSSCKIEAAERGKHG